MVNVTSDSAGLACTVAKLPCHWSRGVSVYVYYMDTELTQLLIVGFTGPSQHISGFVGWVPIYSNNSNKSLQKFNMI